MRTLPFLEAASTKSSEHRHERSSSASRAGTICCSCRISRAWSWWAHPSSHVVEVEIDDEARALSDLYISSGVVTRSMLVDAQHIATATVHRADVLVSWNFKHIVNLRRIHGFNSVNLRQEYPLLEIRTPQEVVPYESE